MKKTGSMIAMLMMTMAVLVTGCDGGGSDDPDPAPPAGDSPAPSMTGSWNGTFGTGASFAFSLVQSGDAITGGYTSSGGSPGTFTGSISGNNVSFTTTVPAGGGNVTAQWSGTVNAERTSMSGTFTIVAGGGGNGTWSATK